MKTSDEQRISRLETSVRRLDDAVAKMVGTWGPLLLMVAKAVITRGMDPEVRRRITDGIALVQKLHPTLDGKEKKNG